MKANELRDMTAVELEKKLKDLKAELFTTCAFSTPSTSWTTPCALTPSRRTSPA